MKKVFTWGLIALIAFSIIFGSWYTIGAGERGVITTFGKASDSVKSPGLHFNVPLIQSVHKLDVQTQKYVAHAGAASKDLQTVSTETSVNYALESASVVELYVTIGKDYEARIIQPAVQEVVKAATAQYTAEELITKRQEVKDKIDIGLKDRLSQRGIVVQEILITNFDFSASFNAAIENKVTAEQQALAAKNKLEQIKYEAEQRITQATAEAEAIRIQAQAIQAQGGAEYVQLQAISKWNGQLPQMTGINGIPFVNVQS